HFIYCIAEFLVMLSHETFHSKQVIKVQDLIKHYDSLLTSGHEPETHDTSSNNLFTNIERLSTCDLLSYGQLSYDTILTSIQNDNLTQKVISISLEKLLIVGQYPKNDIWC
ncbi:unnamed protein product, partial [Rotaria sp. Silwood1]